MGYARKLKTVKQASRQRLLVSCYGRPLPLWRSHKKLGRFIATSIARRSNIPGQPVRAQVRRMSAVCFSLDKNDCDYCDRSFTSNRLGETALRWVSLVGIAASLHVAKLRPIQNIYPGYYNKQLHRGALAGVRYVLAKRCLEATYDSHRATA